MEFPSELREKIRELVTRENTKQLTAAARRLSENYRAESPNGKISAASREDILAYAAVRMPATFAAVSRALELAPERFDGDIRDIQTVLDVGAGTGAGAIAACLITDCRNITCIERESNMIELGRQLLNCLDIRADWIQSDVTQSKLQKADLVVCSYCLNELPENQRASLLTRLADAAERLLIIVEPGTPASFAAMKKTRETLLEMGLKIAAPCPHERECPLPEDDWCHFTARAARSDLHRQLKRAEAPYEDEKFCYVAMTRDDNTLKQVQGGVILRHPIIEKQKITLKLCCEDGIYTRLVTGKSPLFKTARKSKTGDMFPTER